MISASEKNAVQFVKLNRFIDGVESDPAKNLIFVRAGQIATLHWDDERSCSMVNIQGVDDPIWVTQTPDELLALMKDDNASVLGNSTSNLILKVDNDGSVTTVPSRVA